MDEKQDKGLLSDSDTSTRRDFIKAAGKLALYTAPAMMLLMDSNRDALACSSIKVKPKRDWHNRHSNNRHNHKPHRR
jgi:hypothetical protein